MENPEYIAVGLTVATAVGGAVVGGVRWIGGIFSRIQDNHIKVVGDIMSDAVTARGEYVASITKLGDAIDRVGERLAESREQDRAMIIDLARRAPQCAGLAMMAQRETQ